MGCRGKSGGASCEGREGKGCNGEGCGGKEVNTEEKEGDAAAV